MKPGQGSWAQELHLNSTGGSDQPAAKKRCPANPTGCLGCPDPSVHGVQLLLASNDCKDVELVHATTQLEAVLKQLPLLASLVVLDIGTPFHPAFSMIAENCDEFILVTEPQPNAARHTQCLAQELRSNFSGTAKTLNIVTLNRNHSNLKLIPKRGGTDCRAAGIIGAFPRQLNWRITPPAQSHSAGHLRTRRSQ